MRLMNKNGLRTRRERGKRLYTARNTHVEGGTADNEIRAFQPYELRGTHRVTGDDKQVAAHVQGKRK